MEKIKTFYSHFLSSLYNLVKREYEEIPIWFTDDIKKYEDLPRFFSRFDDFCVQNWFGVKIEKSIRDLFGIDAERTLWIIENTTGKWFSGESDKFYFEIKEDAVHFKLVWS